MASSKKLTLKLLVDKEKKRVVFAEADKDFVDILFSFLMLPMGTIIRLLDKKTSLGCMDKLYESVEKLDGRYFQTEACRTMLLRPLYASGSQGFPLENLALNVDDSNTQKFYTCRKHDCCIKSCFYSSIPNARCGCQEIMNFEWYWAKKDIKGSAQDGVFVKGMSKFIISDDLHVMPASTMAVKCQFEKLGIDDGNILEEASMDVTKEVLLNLLRRSLISKSPLSGIFFQTCMTDNSGISSNFTKLAKFEKDPDEDSKKIKINSLVCKSSNKVLYAETYGGGGLVDVLVSFLVMPLGLIVRLLDKNFLIGCVNNLYCSVESLSFDSKSIKSEDCKTMLLEPKLAPYFGCSNSLLPITEMLPGSPTVPGCRVCFEAKKASCIHIVMYGMRDVSLVEMDPKRLANKKEFSSANKRASREDSGSYANEATKFMVTDELEITAFSPLGSIQTAKELGVSFTNLDEREISIGKTEALNLLRACLTSKTPLTTALLPRKN